LTSTKGLNWKHQDSLSTELFTAVAYGGGIFVVWGYHGTILTSKDGMQWTPRNSGITNWNYWSSLAWGNGTFVAVGDTTILTSGDGATWTPANTDAPLNLHNVGFARGMFVAVGDGGTILTSTNGFDWVRCNSGTMNPLYAVTGGNDTFIAAGATGTILQSAQLPTTKLTLGPVFGLGSGGLEFGITGPTGQVWEIQGSTNLADWLSLTNFSSTNGTATFSDRSAGDFSRRFYRAISY
jgi:hypothetical protein